MGRSLSELTPDTRERAEELIEVANDVGIDVLVVSTRRTCDQQRSLYAQGRSQPGNIVTNANGCRSWHVWGRAIDLVVLDDGEPNWNGGDPRYAQLGEIAEELGFKWGGRFSNPDPGHFEYHPGMSIEDICPDPGLCEQLVPNGVDPEEPEPVDPYKTMPAGTFKHTFAKTSESAGGFSLHDGIIGLAVFLTAAVAASIFARHI